MFIFAINIYKSLVNHFQENNPCKLECTKDVIYLDKVVLFIQVRLI